MTATVVTEVRETIGDRLPTAADVPRLATTAMVLAESLRLYPPAWSMGRQALEDVRIGDFVIPRGEHAWFCPWSIHRDARWFRDPNSFRPERWARDLAKTLPRFAYFPFGGGPRLCIGRAFAEMEATLVLAMLVRAFRIEVSTDPAPVPDPSVTLRPKHGVRARISPRD